MKKTNQYGMSCLSMLLLLLLLMTTTSTDARAQLLKGTIRGMQVSDAAVTYAADGYALNEEIYPLTIDEQGCFTFTMEMQDLTADVGIDLGSEGLFGAHLVKGSCVEMTITRQPQGEVIVEFSGAEVELNRWFNQYKQAFDSMKYWSPDETEAKSNASYRALLEEEYAKVKALTPTIVDPKQRDYYTRLAEAQYRWTKIRLIMDDAEQQERDYRKDAEFRQLIEGVDLNDPINYQANLSLTALNDMVKVPFGGTNEAYCREQMALVDRLVTLPNLRRSMVSLVGMNYFMYGKDHTNIEPFVSDFMQWAGKDSTLVIPMVEQLKQRMESNKLSGRGNPAPDCLMETPDGRQVALSSLLKGKFTYIDVWATWCGPCAKEIPHFARLAEQFKDAPQVQFISISVDTNVKAWQTRLQKEQPAWSQFILRGEQNTAFSKAWGIAGIPRFIMIDAEGKIYDADAPRPSMEKAEEILNQQINNN